MVCQGVAYIQIDEHYVTFLAKFSQYNSEYVLAPAGSLACSPFFLFWPSLPASRNRDSSRASLFVPSTLILVSPSQENSEGHDMVWAGHAERTEGRKKSARLCHTGPRSRNTSNRYLLLESSDSRAGGDTLSYLTLPTCWAVVTRTPTGRGPRHNPDLRYLSTHTSSFRLRTYCVGT
jgi:hypothetical protein